MKKLALLAVVALAASVPLIGATVATTSSSDSPDVTDPVRNVALPCDLVSTPGLVSRSSKNLVHVANVCGVVGTDVEFQSRTDLAGNVRDYAFVGTMGGGFRIFDVTNPSWPKAAGGYLDSGWQNDVQVRGDIVVTTFDGVAGEDSSASTCLKTRYPDAKGQGVDIFRLNYNPLTAKFETNLLGCVANPPGGAHNSTLHPSGDWLAISNCCSDWAVDVIDLRGVLTGADPVHRWRLVDASRAGTRCPAEATFTCVVVTGPNGSDATGLWDPHDLQFSADGKTMYVAAVESTFIVDVRRVLSGQVNTLSVISNTSEYPHTLDNPYNIDISHQADVTPDGKILVISDERGGGLGETRCNTDQAGVIGALHFWALAPLKGISASKGASPTSPKKIGVYFNPNPLLAVDPLAPVIAELPRAERGCTVHVFRIGGNGSSAPGPAAAGYDGVSTLGPRELVTAWYGAGVWYVDFSSAPTDADGTAENPRTTWGNTLGWNVMPGAETWSAKEYKGAIYAGDMLRGFDVYRFLR